MFHVKFELSKVLIFNSLLMVVRLLFDKCVLIFTIADSFHLIGVGKCPHKIKIEIFLHDV